MPVTTHDEGFPRMPGAAAAAGTFVPLFCFEEAHQRFTGCQRLGFARRQNGAHASD